MATVFLKNLLDGGLSVPERTIHRFLTKHDLQAIAEAIKMDEGFIVLSGHPMDCPNCWDERSCAFGFAESIYFRVCLNCSRTNSNVLQLAASLTYHEEVKLFKPAAWKSADFFPEVLLNFRFLDAKLPSENPNPIWAAWVFPVANFFTTLAFAFQAETDNHITQAVKSLPLKKQWQRLHVTREFAKLMFRKLFEKVKDGGIFEQYHAHDFIGYWHQNLYHFTLNEAITTDEQYDLIMEWAHLS